MSSSKLVTEYPMVKGDLEWEIRNLGLHFQKCDECWAGENCWTYQTTARGHSETLTSASTKLGAGGGNQSEWHFNLAYDGKFFTTTLHFDGLFQSDGSKVNQSLSFGFNVVAEKTFKGKTEILDGKDSGKKTTACLICIPAKELANIWPNGNLKISVEISHLSDLVNKVVEDELLLDSSNATEDSLSRCYGNLMDNPDLADFTILCNGSPFHAHKFILSVRSPVFRTMLKTEMSESTQNKLEIKDMSVETLKLMLEFIYKGTIETFPEDLHEKIQLLDSAEKYELKGLKSICMRKLFSHPPAEKEVDVGKLAVAASIYGANDRAVKAIKDFCMKNHAKLMENPEYKKAFLVNPQMFVN